MKRKLSTLILILEIASIALLHAIKIKQSEKINQSAVASHFPLVKPDGKIKSSFVSFRLK